MNKKCIHIVARDSGQGKNVLRDDILDLLVTQGVKLIIERENTPLYHELRNWVCRFQLRARKITNQLNKGRSQSIVYKCLYY